MATVYSYDNLGRVTGIDAGAGVVQFGYSYVDDENNIYRKTFDHRSGDPYNEYSYDDLDRLTGVTYHDTDAEAFVMDDLGNRTGDQTLRANGTVDFTVTSTTNRYTSIGGEPITHDEAGNMTGDKDGYVYFYDYENRIVKIEDDSSSTVATFEYDALGRRIRKVDAVASTTSLYYYDPDWRCLAEYDDANSLQAYYVYGGYIDEVLLMRRSGTDYYYLQDHLYSPAALLSSGGSVVERYEYDAYGRVHIMDVAFTPRSASMYGNAFLFQGHILDGLDNGGLEIMEWRYRSYEAYASRWIQVDRCGLVIPGGRTRSLSFWPPSQYAPSMNLYIAFGANPVRIADPLGLWGKEVHHDKTKWWAYVVGYTSKSAAAVAKADLQVDKNLGTSPLPIVGDQSYHFNRNLDGGVDSRLEHHDRHVQQAKTLCLPTPDKPTDAARELGTALHPLQDWVAHGDYGIRDPGGIYVIHNSLSPQRTFGDPGTYPDDPTLDANGPDGRPVESVMIWEWYNGLEGYKQIGWTTYHKGGARLHLTVRLTKETLRDFRTWVKANGGCRCKEYFIRGN